MMRYRADPPTTRSIDRRNKKECNHTPKRSIIPRARKIEVEKCNAGMNGYRLVKWEREQREVSNILPPARSDGIDERGGRKRSGRKRMTRVIRKQRLAAPASTAAAAAAAATAPF